MASVFGLAVVPQLPMFLGLAHLTQQYELLLAIFALLLIPGVKCTRNFWEHRPRSRLELYAYMWPFFAWYALCLGVLGFTILAAPVVAFTSVTIDQAVPWVLGLGVLGGVKALSRRPRIRKLTVRVSGLPRAVDG